LDAQENHLMACYDFIMGHELFSTHAFLILWQVCCQLDCLAELQAGPKYRDTSVDTGIALIKQF
jgi:hypothetical protein